MPRRARFCPAVLPVHLIQRGNNRHTMFTCNDDLAAYAHWLADGAERFGVSVHGWVLMTDHVHLMATPAHDESLSRLCSFSGAFNVRYFNDTYTRNGTLFEDRFKTCIVPEDRYLFNCLRYMELNPVRAGMVRDPGDYRWSSFRARQSSARRQHRAGIRDRNMQGAGAPTPKLTRYALPYSVPLL